MIALHASSLADSHAIAAAVAVLSRPGDVIVLAGEMGAGKTAFAQGFGAALGVTDPITSPTFTLVHTYPGRRFNLHHADVYRLDRIAEVADLALAELVEGDGVLLVEWGDAISSMLGDHLEITLAPAPGGDESARNLTLRGVGRSWASRWDRLAEALRPWVVGGADDGGSPC
jgi:tRNA threonylcarbamoyladenosine biosynthesis protein TsaE